MIKLVSIVVPVLNSSESLTRLLEALSKQQTAYSYEVVVVDDGSKIDLEPVRELFKLKLLLKWHKLLFNRGPAYARNEGIKLAEGDIVLFTDADCVPRLNWVQKMTEPFEEPQVTGVKGVYETDQTDTWAQLAQLEFEERYSLLEKQDDIDFVDTYSGGYRRLDLQAVQGFDTSFMKADNEDVDLSFRIKARGGKFVFQPDAIVKHTHKEGWLNYAMLKFSRGYWRVKVYQKHPKKTGNDSYTPLSLKIQIALLCTLPFMFLLKSTRWLWKIIWT